MNEVETSSRICCIIRAEVCVICRRLRQITQPDLYLYRTKVNVCIVNKNFSSRKPFVFSRFWHKQLKLKATFPATACASLNLRLQLLFLSIYLVFNHIRIKYWISFQGAFFMSSFHSSRIELNGGQPQRLNLMWNVWMIMLHAGKQMIRNCTYSLPLGSKINTYR